MTLLSVRNQLLGLLTDRDTLTPADFAAIKLTPAIEPYRDDVIRQVLKDLTEVGMIRDLRAPGETVPSAWVLTVQLGHSGQQLTIGYDTASQIAEEINAYRDACELEHQWPEADALHVTEDTILMLLSIISDLRDEDDGPSRPPLEGEEWKEPA